MTTATHRTVLRSAILLVALAASACTKFTVRTDRNPATDFGRYRTFAWMPIAKSPPNDQDTGDRGINNRIYAAVERKMQSRGYAAAQSDSADLLLTFRLLRTDGWDDADIPYAAQWHRGAYLEAVHATPDAYQRGTLIVDAVDRTQNVLVWRGSASARLLPQLSYAKRAERADTVVDQIFDGFPSR